MQTVSGSVTIRVASSEDLDDILELAGARRRQYAVYQPVFWRAAADAVDQQRPYLAGLLQDGQVIAFVAVTDSALRGFALGTVIASPPVYDPGGPTCLVDDFTVADPVDWPTIGVELLRAVGQAARQRGAAQIVVITAHLDTAKRTALAASGLSLASEWWVNTLGTD